jgi:ABC-type polysaccharide/polyol phosphate transport system ATPase subunit
MAKVTVSAVSLRYPIYSTSRQRSILGLAANRATFGRVARDAGSIPCVDALDNVSFRLNDGDRLALVGRNGSGKTTLLKLCAGLLLPTFGNIEIEGSRSAILSPGAGLDHEKTGLENIDMVGRLLGASRAQRKLLVEDVAEFTELGDFLALPTRTYSAGMLIRLMFALATSLPRDILIVDEYIGAGDALFVEKAAARIQGLFSKAKILVLATHAGEIAAQMCNRAIWMESGRPVMSGTPEDVWDAYINQKKPRTVYAVA